MLYQTFNVRMKILLYLICFLGIPMADCQIPSKPIVHEWGTFTTLSGSNGLQASGLFLEEAALPPFVYNLSNKVHTVVNGKGHNEEFWRDAENYANSFVKMETPVLYFYSDCAIDSVEVGVNFPQGTISQFYPNRTRGEINFQTMETLDLNGIPLNSFDLKKNNGFISWTTDILAPNTTYDKITNADSVVMPIWLAPRKTKSNLVRVNNEVEKYLFYRGVGSFASPVTLGFCENNKLLVKNNIESPLNYYLVYEYTNDGQIRVWGTGNINSNDSFFVEPSFKNLTIDEWNVYKNQFVSALITAGLYEDEAVAMLNTWDDSYFHTQGVKLFYTVPREFTDKVLPINFSIEVSDLQRVMVGRAEIVDKIKDRMLVNIDTNDIQLFAKIEPDCYKYAYQYLRLNDNRRAFLNPNFELNYRNCGPENQDLASDKSEISILNNPFDQNLTVSINNTNSISTTIEIFDITGRQISKEFVSNSQNMKLVNLNMENAQSGVYILKITQDQNVKMWKVMKR